MPYLAWADETHRVRGAAEIVETSRATAIARSLDAVEAVLADAPVARPSGRSRRGDPARVLVAACSFPAASVVIWVANHLLAPHLSHVPPAVSTVLGVGVLAGAGAWVIRRGGR